MQEASELEAFPFPGCTGAPGNIRWWKQSLQLLFAKASGSGLLILSLCALLRKDSPDVQVCLLGVPHRHPKRRESHSSPFGIENVAWLQT